jgi:exopolyphosphatase/guanosine-5'-triphosphate,3'-diphosphate pyrophosphatase
MRVAAIDIGTNSVLLLVAEERAGRATATLERATITRLGQGVDRSRTLAPDAIERTLACLSRYADDLREAKVERLDVVGTSAMRDARGGEDFVERARAILGVAPRTIAGEDEAALTFEGALSGLDVADGAAATVFDVGGGSTEVVRRDAGGGALAMVSLDVGSVRLTERHVRSDPPARAELDAVRADVRAALASAPLGGAGSLVGVAGTVTTLAAYALGVAPYDGARVHGSVIERARIVAAADELAAMPLASRRALPTVDAKRADVIVAGAVIVVEVLERAGASSLVVSDRGVRWGLAQRLLRARE